MKGTLFTITGVGSSAARSYKGGVDGLCSAYGDFGGSSLTVEFSPDEGTTWIPCQDSAISEVLTFTANANGRIDCPEGLVRITATGGTPGTLNVVLFGRR